MKADLHNHSTFSDGTLTPAAIIERAAKNGITLVSVTDHDSVSGVEEAISAGLTYNVEVLSGIEISAYSNCEIHILGYNVEWNAIGFMEELDIIKKYRINRNIEIGKKLENFNVKLDIDFAADGIGRMNIARELVSCNYCKDINEAFDVYLGVRGKTRTDLRRATPIEAVKLITKYGGLAVLAHPKKYYLDKRLEMMISGLKAYGLRGIETYYPTHTHEETEALNILAKRYGLIATGGSDFHGEGERMFYFEPDVNTLKALKAKNR